MSEDLDFDLDLDEGGVPLHLPFQTLTTSDSVTHLDRLPTLTNADLTETYTEEPENNPWHSESLDAPAGASSSQAEATTLLMPTTPILPIPDQSLLSQLSVTDETRSSDSEYVPPQSPHQVSRHLHQGNADSEVLDFLESWAWDVRSRSERMILTDETVSQWKSPGDIDGPSSDSNRDIQGLNWGALGMTRTSARRARNECYLKHCEAQVSIAEEKGRMQYRLSRLHRDHKPRTQHWQLRHTLAATSRNDIFYGSRDRVIHTSLSAPGIADVVIDTKKSSHNGYAIAANWRVTTLTASPPPMFSDYYSPSFLIAGGYGGEYSILNLYAPAGTAPTEGYVSTAEDAITTHIHIHPSRTTSASSAVFCSNDGILRSMDVLSGTWLTSLTCQEPLNCAATSPDARVRVVVGDTCETFITDAEKDRTLTTLKHHTDHAFACAWSPDGWTVATGAQDNLVMVYDARNWNEPLARLETELGCARSLQFMQTSSDGQQLVVGEADDYLVMYDTLTLEKVQLLDFFGAVTGVACLDGSGEVVVGNGDVDVGGLMVYERAGSASNVAYDDKVPLPSNEEEWMSGMLRHYVTNDHRAHHCRHTGALEDVFI